VAQGRDLLAGQHRPGPLDSIHVIVGGRVDQGQGGTSGSLAEVAAWDPPNVVETDARTWLAVATGALRWDGAWEAGVLRASGHRTDLAEYPPLG
jgi:hypothetical protein